MKILLTVHQFVPDYFSGTEVLTLTTAKALRARGHEVVVLTGFPDRSGKRDDQRFDQYEHEGLKVYRFHHAYVPMGGQNVITELDFNNVLAARYFARIVADFKPDVAHFFHFGRLGTAMIDVAVRAGIPAYYTPTDFWSLCPPAQLLRGGKPCPGPSRYGGNCVKHVAELSLWPYMKLFNAAVPDVVADFGVWLTAKGWLLPYPLHKEVLATGGRKAFNMRRLNWLHGVVAPTQLMTGALTSNGLNPQLIHQSAYGIDIPREGTAIAARDPKTPLTVGYIGTLAPHKGCHVLVEAFRHIDDGRAKLKIYGNLVDFPDYLAKMKAIAAGSPNIEFLGTFPSEKIADVLAGVDLLVVPSVWYENMPLVIFSALAAKRPVVVSDYPGMTEVITHEVNGLVFPPGDSESLSKHLVRLRDEPALLPSLSQNCRRPKSSAEYADELLALYAKGPLVPLAARDTTGLQDLKPL
ncbi:MAG: glycosyltransferase family 4 protein [Rhodospirillaceae bacterium]|nr:glycosyltransferase family 4 protein [Rhodospirillaceae bacterium]